METNQYTLEGELRETMTQIKKFQSMKMESVVNSLRENARKLMKQKLALGA